MWQANIAGSSGIAEHYVGRCNRLAGRQADRQARAVHCGAVYACCLPACVSSMVCMPQWYSSLRTMTAMTIIVLPSSDGSCKVQGRISPCWESMSAPRHIFLMLCNTHAVTAYELPIYVPSDAEKADPLLYAKNVREYMVSAWLVRNNYALTLSGCCAPPATFTPSKTVPGTWRRLQRSQVVP